MNRNLRKDITGALLDRGFIAAPLFGDVFKKTYEFSDGYSLSALVCFPHTAAREGDPSYSHVTIHYGVKGDSLDLSRKDGSTVMARYSYASEYIDSLECHIWDTLPVRTRTREKMDRILSLRGEIIKTLQKRGYVETEPFRKSVQKDRDPWYTLKRNVSSGSSTDFCFMVGFPLSEGLRDQTYSRLTFACEDSALSDLTGGCRTAESYLAILEDKQEYWLKEHGLYFRYLAEEVDA